jgi:glycosyltransferase involved in cell wall biosynthesis
MTKIPKISVGLPVYNGEAYLAKAIESILDQSYPDFELIISDNASTDRTEEICRDFAARDSRVRFFKNQVNIGGARNHNRVFELARGEFFKLASHDDLYPREMLKRCLEVFEKGPPSIAVVYSYFEVIDEFGNRLEVRTDPIEKKDPRPHLRLARLLLNIGHYSASYGLIRSEVRRKIEQGSFAYSDRVFLAELAMLGEFREIKEALLCLRHHSERSFGAKQTSDYVRAWFNPQAAKKPQALPIEARADLEVVRSVLRLPLPLGERILCLFVAVAVPCWLRFREWSFPLRRKLGLALSVWRKKDRTLIRRISRR